MSKNSSRGYFREKLFDLQYCSYMIPLHIAPLGNGILSDL